VDPRADLNIVKNLVLTGIRSPDHPARSQSLYRRCYPVHAEEIRNLKISKDICKVTILPTVVHITERAGNFCGGRTERPERPVQFVFRFGTVLTFIYLRGTTLSYDVAHRTVRS
jgi:hypothetical protein